tara:strand:- start:1926 stop:2921 length:996 start_codon:yes stop_codon:yes gene_type:complete
MKKILVTGADGFIGSHLVEALVKKNYKVKALVYYNSFNSFGWIDKIDSKIKNKIEVISGDIRDINIIKSSLKNCQCVINLAALIGIPYSYFSPKSYYDTNVEGTLNILQAAKDLKVKKIIHTSTSEVYGTPEYLPIDETHRINAQSPYAASKVSADQLALSFYQSFSTPVSIIRPFNTFGPRQSARAIIPTIILQILSGKKKLKLGNLYSTRDLSFIDDTVDGFIAMIKKNTFGETINLGTGYDVSIKKLVTLIAKAMSVKVEILIDEKRVRPKSSEVNRLRSNNKKAKKILNWKPKYLNEVGLLKGLSKTIDWFSKKENLKDYKSEIYNI